MKTCSIFLLFIFFATSIFAQETMKAPLAKKIPKKLVTNNGERVDNYYWLNERDNPEVIDYLTKENQYLEKNLAHTKALQEKIYNEIIGRLKPDEETAPYLENGYFYYKRYEPGKEHPIYCRKKGDLSAPEEILLNVNDMAGGFDYYAVRGLEISPDNRFAAFGVDTVSRRKYTLYVKDLESGKILDESIGNTEANFEWSNDSRNIYFTTKDSTLRPDKLFRYTLFTPVESAQEIYHETDNTFYLYIDKDRSDKLIYVVSESTLSSEYRLIDANDISKAPTMFSPREDDILYYVVQSADGFYVLTNWNALNFKVMKCTADKTYKENWQEYIAHREDVYVENITAFKDFHVLVERNNGLIQLRIINPGDKTDHYVDFDESAYVVELSDNEVYDTKELRYNYESLTTPATIYDYDVSNKTKKLIKQDEVLGGFKSSDYQTERIWAPARDGKSIPVSIVYRKDKFTKGKASPLLLYGYGSYGLSEETWFRSYIISLLDRGFIYAIAHIRGGADLGRQWYEDGKLLHKKNTFTDFIDAGEYLVKEDYTSKDKLCIYGGSAGGLLIGAVVNMRPDLCKAACAAVPFVDVVTTMLDETIPLTTGEFDEWGNPKVKEYYDYMLSYSPYDNVGAKDYPAILVTTGLHDSQVQYFEPAKWVAKMRALKTGNNPLYLFTQMEAGHGGASGRYERYKKTALVYTFFLDELGITD